MNQQSVSLEQREQDYRAAEMQAAFVATAWFDARVVGRVPRELEDRFDAAEARLRRAKRRYEDTLRREAKRMV